MIYLYNEYFSLVPRLKRLLGKKERGPAAVFSSLTRGLGELGLPFSVNFKLNQAIQTACVLSDAATLRWAIKQKRQGNIKTIVAGPNIAITPNDEGGILKSKELDRIIVPSQWVKDFYISQAPELSEKIFVWAAGVTLPEPGLHPKIYDFLIYNKLKKNPLVDRIMALLRAQGLTFCEIIYGHYPREEYLRLLDQSKAMIYLSESESQGLAMFEAWAANVPALVWDRGFMQSGKYRWEGKTGSPYVSEKNGMVFKDFEIFSAILPKFRSQQFSPRQWVEDNASNKICAQKYLGVIGRNL